MLKRHHAFFGIGLLAALSGCEQGSGSSNQSLQEGTINCSSSYVSDYNSVNSALRGAQASGMSVDLGTLQRAQGACDTFFSRHAGVSCYAKVDSRTVWVSSHEFRADCDRVRDAIRQANAPRPAPAPAPAPAPVSDACSDEFIAGYNEIGKRLKFAAETHTDSSVDVSYLRFESGLEACETFLSRHAGRSCKAQVSGRAQWVSADDRKRDCDLGIQARDHFESTQNLIAAMPACSTQTTQDRKDLRSAEADIKALHANAGLDVELRKREILRLKEEARGVCSRLRPLLLNKVCKTETSDIAMFELMSSSALKRKCDSVLAL